MNALINIMEILRGPRGCPWDQKQTIDSLMPCLMEEVYEVIDAVNEHNHEKIAEELGDVLCIISMIIVIGKENKLFDKKTVVNSAITKMRHRHPHVFGSKKARSADQAHDIWHDAKNKEKNIRERISALDDLSDVFPALMRASKIQKRAARAGFDWPSPARALSKVKEELRELEVEIRRPSRRSQKRIKEEFGDFLFTIVHLGCKLDVSAEHALLDTNKKFIKRFRTMEKRLKKENKPIKNMPLTELKKAWAQTKPRTRRSRS